MALDKMCDLMHEQHNTKGLRVDIQIKDQSSNQEIWVDTTCIHPTCMSRIRAELKQVKEEIRFDEDQRRGINNHDRELKFEGDASRDQTRFKHKTYSPLIPISKKQTNDGRRMKQPQFLAGVVTTYGELGLETIKLVEFLTWAYGKKKALEGHREDGIKLSTLTAHFRNDLRMKMMISVAKGLSRMLNTAGLPSGTCKNKAARGR